MQTAPGFFSFSLCVHIFNAFPTLFVSVSKAQLSCLPTDSIHTVSLNFSKNALTNCLCLSTLFVLPIEGWLSQSSHHLSYAFFAVYSLFSGLLEVDAAGKCRISIHKMGTSWPHRAWAILLFVVIAYSHGNNEKSEDKSMHQANVTSDNTQNPISYFEYQGYSSWVMAHIAVMTMGWVFVLPLG